MKNIINLVVEEELHGKRIDVVIAKKNEALSRTRIKNLIIKGNLSINDKIENYSSALDAADEAQKMKIQKKIDSLKLLLN